MMSRMGRRQLTPTTSRSRIMRVELIGGKGDVLKSAGNCGALFHRFEGDDGSGLLRRIDSYGETYFSSSQMTEFLAAWEEVYPPASAVNEQRCWHAVNMLARECAGGTSLCLKFVGD